MIWALVSGLFALLIPQNPLTDINNTVYISLSEEQRVQALLADQGATFEAGKGSHLKVTLNDRNSVLPMHSKELGTGLVAAIKKQLGLK
jgi:mRNA interferase HicA